MPANRTASERNLKLITLGTILSLAALILAAVAARLDVLDVSRTGLVSDINAYAEIGESLRSGGVPYVDIPIEHLPLTIALIAALTTLATVIDVELWLVWVPAMSMCFIAAAVLIDRIDFSPGHGGRFLLCGAPLLPLVLFRVEPFVILLAALGLSAYASSRWRAGGLWTFLGSLAKGWPIALLSIPWASNRRADAVLTGAGSIAVLLLVASQSGFQEARSFAGVHSETVLGSLLLTWRHIAGTAVGLEGTAGAVYVEAPTAAVVLNAIPGIALAGVWLWAFLRKDLAMDQQVAVAGIAVLAMMLASPLFSTQFLVWVLPFVVFQSHRIRSVFVASATVGLITITFFDPTSSWWALAVLAKNCLILAVAALWVRDFFVGAQRASMSPRNLPV